MMTPCPSGKQAYLTATAAWAVIRRRTGKQALLSHKQPGKPGGHAYRCAACHQWHITHQIHRHRPARRPPRRLAPRALAGLDHASTPRKEWRP